jgi:hypothetical protein
VELDRVVPPSGNLWLAGQQIWLGPAMTGRAVRLWAGLERVHVLLDGYRVKTPGQGLPPAGPVMYFLNGKYLTEEPECAMWQETRQRWSSCGRSGAGWRTGCGRRGGT